MEIADILKYIFILALNAWSVFFVCIIIIIEGCSDDTIFYYYFELVFNDFEDVCKYEL